MRYSQGLRIITTLKSASTSVCKKDINKTMFGMYKHLECSFAVYYFAENRYYPLLFGM